MPKISVHTEFKFSPDGNHVDVIAVGEHDVSDRCALVAVQQLKVATLAVKRKSKTAGKSHDQP